MCNTIDSLCLLACTNMLYNTWSPDVYHSQQPCYQPNIDCTYWPVLGYFNDSIIIKFFNKTIFSEEFDEVHKVVMDGIISNVASLVQTVKYCAINAEDPTRLGYYVVKSYLGNFTLPEYITTYVQVSKAGELVVKS